MQQTDLSISSRRKGRLRERYDNRVRSPFMTGGSSELFYLIFALLIALLTYFACCRWSRTFMHIYQMDCPRARERLLVMGVPEPIKSSAHDEHSKVAVTVAETVQHFITTMDAVKVR